MSANQRPWLTALRRTVTSRYAAAAIGLLVVIGLAVWPQALLLTLAYFLVLSVVWYGHTWLLARASAARFLAASLVIHCLLALWLWGVPLAQAVVEHAENIRASVASQLFDDEPQPARPSGRPAYEKVADLRAEDAVAPNVVRQAAAPANVPEDIGPLVPTIPGHAVHSLPPERLLFVPPRLLEVVRQPQEIERQSVAQGLKPVEIQLELPAPLPAEAVPKEQPIEARPVTPPRQDLTAPVPVGPEPRGLPELKRLPPAELLPEVADQPVMREAPLAPGTLPDGRRQPGRLAPAEPREPQAELKAEAAPTDRLPPDARVTLPRLAPMPQVPAPMPDETTGPNLRRNQPAAVHVVSPQPVEVQPKFGPARDPLPRKPAPSDRTAMVEDKVVPQVPLLLRQKEVRQQSLKQFGGTDASEAAVARGLDWLAAQQNANGSWSLHQARYPDVGTVHSDPAGTGVALLPFLGAGNTHQSGKHQQTVARALQWLVAQQGPNGTWPNPDHRPMYGHGIASIALCEAYGMTQDPKLRGPAQKALDYIVKAQHAPSGGWRYTPNQAADTSVVGWQLMALKSGEMAGLSVPRQTFEGVKRWLASVEANRPVGGQFGYQSATSTPAMTAQGLLCLQYLGARRDDPRMKAGTDYLLGHLPRPQGDTSYYWYHANQVMYHMQGKHWKAWNDKLRDLLVSTQVAKGALAGSWQPIDTRERPGGRLYATALRLLMLEVYYRHLPLYQQLEK